MGIFSRKSAPKLDRPVNTQILGDTYKTMEMLQRRYGLNPEMAELINHAFGEAYICAAINAKVCASGTLRLWRTADGSTTKRRAAKITRAGSIRHKAMSGGRYGAKLADFTQGGAEMEEVTDHAVLEFVKRPNWMYPGNYLNRLSWTFRWVTGNAFDHGTFSGTLPLLLNPLFAHYTQIIADDEEGITSYRFGRSNQSWHDYSPDEVIHYRLEPNMDSPLYGRSPLQAVFPHVDLLRDSLIFDIAMAKNGQRPDFMVSLPEGTNPEQEKEFAKRWESKFRGVANWAKPFFTAGKADVTPLTFPEKDLLSMPKREEASKLIRRAYGHDESQADSSDATYASALMGDSRYLGGTIEPALQQDAEEKAKILEWFGLDPDVYSFAYDPMVEKDEAKYAERLRLDTAQGLRTANEYRVEVGLEKINDPMADKLLVNGQPLGQAAQAANPFGGLLGGFGSPKPQDPAPTNDEPSPPGSAEKPTDGTETAKSVADGIDLKSILALEDPRWRQCDGCVATKDDDDVAADPLLKEALRRYAGTMQGVAREIIDSAQMTAIAAYARGEEPNLASQRDAAAVKFDDVMKDMVRFGVANFLKEAGAVGSVTVPEEAFNIAPTRALEFLKGYTFELADDVMGTTAEMAKRAVQAGLEQGLSTDQIAESMSGVPEYRARAIARTEVQRAVQHGKREGMLAVGVEKHRLLTAPGVRKSHAEIAAQGAISIDEPFVRAGETYGGETFTRDLYAPPLGVNCRCSVLPVYEEDA